jgi:hypothetical protein
MSNKIQTIELPDGGTFELYADSDAESPREWGNVGKMFCFHKRYRLGDKHDYRDGDYSGWDDFKKQLERDHDVLEILPLSMYDHSGITISTTPFSCPWDSGQIGFILADKDDVRKAFQVKRITARIRKSVHDGLVGEVKAYDQYLQGDVYGFILKDADGEDGESCWGFFGLDLENNGMLDYLPDEYHEAIKEAL